MTIDAELRFLTINLEDAIAKWTSDGLSAEEIMTQMIPVLELWNGYPDRFNRPYGTAQYQFENRLILAGYDLESRRGGPLMWIRAIDNWNTYENMEKTWIKKLSFEQINGGSMDEASDRGLLYLPMSAKDLGMVYASSEGATRFRNFLDQKVGIGSLQCGVIVYPSPIASYLRWWRRLGMSLDAIQRNLVYLLDFRHQYALGHDDKLAFPVSSPAGHVRWGLVRSCASDNEYRGC